MEIAKYVELGPGSSVDRFAAYELVLRNTIISIQLLREKKLRAPQVSRAISCGPVHKFVDKVPKHCRQIYAPVHRKFRAKLQARVTFSPEGVEWK